MFSCRSHVKTFLGRVSRAGNRTPARVNKYIHTTAISRCKDEKDPKEDEISGSISSKYEVFVDSKSPIIFDVEQEREKFYEVTDESEAAPRRRRNFEGILQTRGETGVFCIEELVAILNKEKVLDIVVIKIPEEYGYVDYFVIVTGRSWKHMRGVAEYVRSVWKFKTNSEGMIPVIEGNNSKDWKALDLGNIVLHVMSQSAREWYDVESLWSVGPKYDTKSNLTDDDQHYNYESILSKLMPATEVS